MVFLYIVNEDLSYILLTFFNDEISEWNKSDNKYILRFTHKTLKEPYFLEREFNKEMASKLKRKLGKLKIKN